MGSVTVDGVEIPYTDTGGDGPVVVFVHGAFVTGAVWADVIARLDGLRCIAPTFPLGGHAAAGPDADLRVGTTSRRVLGFLRALKLRDVTVVGAGTGGGLVLSTLIDDTSRYARLVLTNCASFQHFPPRGLAPVVALARRAPALAERLFGVLSRGRGFDLLTGAVAARPVPEARRAESAGAFPTSAETRREAVRVVASVHSSLTLAAGSAVRGFDRPVTVVWGTADRLFFPRSHGRRLAAAFAQGRLVEAPGARTFVMLDAPDLLAAEVRTAAESVVATPEPAPDYAARDESGRISLNLTPRDE